MGAARLILIEGMIGSGKTTTATRVGDWLARRGENVRVFCECAADHPIRTRTEDRLRAAADPQAPGPPGSAGDGRAAGSGQAVPGVGAHRDPAVQPVPFTEDHGDRPQHNWQVTLTRICATARPSPTRRKTQT